jgi:hypothetical protein
MLELIWTCFHFPNRFNQDGNFFKSLSACAWIGPH